MCAFRRLKRRNQFIKVFTTTQLDTPIARNVHDVKKLINISSYTISCKAYSTLAYLELEILSLSIYVYVRTYIKLFSYFQPFAIELYYVRFGVITGAYDLFLRVPMLK